MPCKKKKMNGFQEVLGVNPRVWHMGRGALPTGTQGTRMRNCEHPTSFFPLSNSEKPSEWKRKDALAQICAYPIHPVPAIATCPSHFCAEHEGGGYPHVINKGTKLHGWVEPWPRLHSWSKESWDCNPDLFISPGTRSASCRPLVKAILGYGAQTSQCSLWECTDINLSSARL